jgi:hypothetical protein
MGWNRGSVIVARNLFVPAYTLDISTYRNTTILCTQQISSAKYNVVVDNNGRVQRFTRLTPLTYDDSSHFDSSTTTASFKAQLGTIIRTNPSAGRDTGSMHNDAIPHSFPHFFADNRLGKTLCDPATPPPSFEDAQLGFDLFYKRLVAIVLGQNYQRIFRSTTKDGSRKPQATGERIALANRMSMDPVMFYIASILLGFTALSSVVIFGARPKRFLPRFPDTLAAEIGFFYASAALTDTAGTALMSSAMRERHLARLGWSYGYGRFKGKDGKVHLGIERMGPIEDYRDAS